MSVGMDYRQDGYFIPNMRVPVTFQPITFSYDITLGPLAELFGIDSAYLTNLAKQLHELKYRSLIEDSKFIGFKDRIHND